MGFQIFGMFAAYIACAYWCYEVVARGRDDLTELREAKETGRKIGIIIVWAITIMIAIFLAGLTFVLVPITISELRAW
jgi:hypothetical protein